SAFRSQGPSPRALAENLSGTLTAKFAGAAAAGAPLPVSALDVAFDLPGVGKAASLQATAVYNGETVTVTGTVRDPKAALAGGRFPATLRLASAPVNGGFDGTVQQAPLPGLDGRL